MSKLKPALLAIPVVLGLTIAGFVVARNGSGAPNPDQQNPVATPKPKVNLIEIAKRPYVTLEPLTARNELQLTVHTLPLAAKDMEVLLEYDRNKGVMDAVLKSFSLTNPPSIHKIFLGSKSTGGHVTYHDDVVGGKLTLTFSGDDEPYSLEVPWRYDDTQPRYTQISTSDLKFQFVLDEPYRTPKILVMQSPGLPTPVDGQVLAGPYLIRGVGVLPNIRGQLTIRLPQAEPEAKLLIFDGQTWQPQTVTITDHTLTATVPLASVYVVVK
jgi:hypothetical protein